MKRRVYIGVNRIADYGKRVRQTAGPVSGKDSDSMDEQGVM